MRIASNYECHLEITREDRTVNARSIMGVMMLAASQGTSIEICAEGHNEQEAIQAITQLINDRFGEST